jgi:hypothetical protein
MQYFHLLAGDALVGGTGVIGENLELRVKEHRVVGQQCREIVRNALGVVELGSDDERLGGALAEEKSGNEGRTAPS